MAYQHEPAAAAVPRGRTQNRSTQKFRTQRSHGRGDKSRRALHKEPENVYELRPIMDSSGGVALDTEPFPTFSDHEAEEVKMSPKTYEISCGTPEKVPGKGNRPSTRGVIEPLLHEASAERQGSIMVSQINHPQH